MKVPNFRSAPQSSFFYQQVRGVVQRAVGDLPSPLQLKKQVLFYLRSSSSTLQAIQLESDL